MMPEVPLALDQAYDERIYRDIWYEERQAVGYLHFEFYNGAMSTEHCQRLREAFRTKREVLTSIFAQRDVPKQCLTVRDEGMVSRPHRVSEM
jgi:hypothetical protein